MKKELLELVELAVTIYSETQSGNKVAARLGVSHSTAYRLLMAGGVRLPDRHSREVNDRKKKLHGANAASVAADYASGMRMKDMRAKHGVSTWAIRAAAKDAGLVMRCQGGKYRAFSLEDASKAADLYRTGWSQVQIAAKFKSTQITVSRLLHSAGVQTRSGHTKGSAHGSWRGGIVEMPGGYLGEKVSNDDPMFSMANSCSYIAQHRLVMARALGRILARWETVHHIDGNRKNNALSNLQLRFGNHGNGVAMKCAQCGSTDIKCEPLK